MPADLTIEQLAAESGMTVRNIRAHQARGLLASPEVRLRTGYYGAEHLAQLRLIRELQTDGFNLAGIKRLLSDRERTEERLARFRASLSPPRDAEQPRTFTAAQLRERFALDAEDADQVLVAAQRIGALRQIADDRFSAPSPSLVEVASEVVARGISPTGALAVFEEAQRHADAVAAAFVRLFVGDVWRRFELDGMPAERWPEINDAIDRLRQLAGTAVAAGFARALDARIDAAFAPPQVRRPRSEEVPR